MCKDHLVYWLYCMCRLCVALTGPTAALQDSVVTWPLRCVRREISHGLECLWWRNLLKKNRAFLLYLYPPFRNAKVQQSRRRVLLFTVTTILIVLMVLLAADTHKASGFAAHTLRWVVLYIVIWPTQFVLSVIDVTLAKTDFYLSLGAI